MNCHLGGKQGVKDGGKARDSVTPQATSEVSLDFLSFTGIIVKERERKNERKGKNQ